MFVYFGRYPVNIRVRSFQLYNKNQMFGPLVTITVITVQQWCIFKIAKIILLLTHTTLLYKFNHII